MGKLRGFIEFDRKTPKRLPVADRLKNWTEFEQKLDEPELARQGGRCMDCGIPFCHKGCPLGNIIPDWNHYTFLGKFDAAIDRLHSTNNFPEFTGRVCPAPCEEACVLNINNDPVTIKQIEKQTADRAWANGEVKPELSKFKTGRTVAVVGSGPAGMAAAQQLARAGHDVTLYERADRIGGLLRYGIPDFKMEKDLIDRRMTQMAEEGVVFKTGVNVGVDITAAELREQYDAVVLSGGATQARDLPIEGRNLKGVHFAMEFLTEQNKVVAGDTVPNQLHAKGKHVIVLGGGDTGSDCLGTSHRHGAKQVCQYELLPEPPESVNKDVVWPNWPIKLRTSSSQEEGGVRDYAILTKRLSGDAEGNVKKLHGVRVSFQPDADGRQKMVEEPGTEFEVEADLVLLAMGFTGPEKSGLLTELGVELDERGNVKADESYETSVPGVFACGDLRRGQSLVVWAIWEGREAARGVDAYLRGHTDLPASPLQAGMSR
ncbi:MAG TPA: glutamate synthase subunit beta [Polyangiales bacterium]|nr:glutamate synthase subunit beta [Polyangiales bacterium]